MIFYKLDNATTFDGKSTYIDITDKLNYFLKAEKLSLKCIFKTGEMNKMSLFSIYFKDYYAKDLRISMDKGYITVAKRNVVLTTNKAFNDNNEHTLYLKIDENGILVYVDGDLIIKDKSKYPFCNFDYTNIINVGRDVTKDEEVLYFKGEISHFEISNDIMEYNPNKYNKDEIKKTPLFYNGLDHMVNYRIPTIIKLPSGALVASADARMQSELDNPNNIFRAVRISYDNGETWTDNNFTTNFGGLGTCDGAAALDASLLYDEKTKTLFKLFTHSSKGIGFGSSCGGTGFNEKGEKILFGKDEKTYFINKDGQIVDENDNKTNYTVDSLGKVYEGDTEISSICHGNDRMFKQLDTSFLKLIYSKDEGRTWSLPIDLNDKVKEPWMKFLGPGPGIGIQIKNGKHKGRLIYPIYFTNEHGISSNGVIYSDDGINWIRGASVNDGRVFNGEKITAKDTKEYGSILGECQVTEIEDGKIKIFLRNVHYGKIATSISSDGGESFSEVSVVEESKECFCQSSVLRIETKGKVYHTLLNPHNEKHRINGVIKLSDDNTKSFKYQKVLEKGEFLYSCMVQIDDDTIGVLYEGKNIDIYFVKLDINWLLK